jgi:predicted DCC family thiol-disulfide oxidoreductase YuxK
VTWQSLDDLSVHGVTVDQVNAAAWWVEPGRPPQGGHLAIGAALSRARRPWSLLGRMLLLPPFRWLGGPVYRWVARNRYRLPGATDACRLDQPR